MAFTKHVIANANPYYSGPERLVTGHFVVDAYLLPSAVVEALADPDRFSNWLGGPPVPLKDKEIVNSSISAELQTVVHSTNCLIDSGGAIVRAFTDGENFHWFQERYVEKLPCTPTANVTTDGDLVGLGFFVSAYHQPKLRNFGLVQTMKAVT